MKKNTVKRIVVVLVVLILVISLSACGGKFAGSDYLGTWKATVATMDDVELNVDKILGDFTMGLEADGTVNLDINGDKGSGEWKETKDGIALLEGDRSMEFTSDGEKLVVEQNSIEIYFEKIK